MKILVIGRSFPDKKTGMIGTFEYEQAQALKKLGNEVRYSFCDTRSVFRIRTVETISKEEDGLISYGMQLPVGRLPYPVFAKLKSKYMIEILKTVLKEFEPDVIHIHFPLITLTGEIWNFLRDRKIKLVITEHFTKVQNKKINAREREFLKVLVSEADDFICVSEALKKSVQELTGCENNILVVPNMVNSTFSHETKNDDGIYRFACVGRIYKIKQVDFVVKAFSLFLKTHENSHLHIVGNGPYFNKVSRLVKKLGISDNVTLYGALPREEVNKVLNLCNCLVSASRYETFGVPVVEGWYCGIPAVIPDNFPILNYVNEKNAVLYKQGSIEELEKAMETAFNQKFDDRYISDYANELFRSDIVAKRIEEIYEK